MFKFIPSITVAAGVITALSGFSATSAQAARLDLSTWDSVGDVDKSINSAILTNAAVNNADLDISNLNLTGAAPVNPGLLDSSLGLFIDPLGPTAQEGSSLYTDLIVGTDDILSFNWSAFNLDPDDRLFAAIGGRTFNLTGSGPSSFSYTFTTAGTFRVGVGVVDQKDFVNSSVLSITNAQLTPAVAIPSPALLPGMIGFGLSLIRKRRSVG
jgi:hypothetical protein